MNKKFIIFLIQFEILSVPQSVHMFTTLYFYITFRINLGNLINK